MTVRVLLVDDAPDVRRLVRTALRFRGGFEVVGEAAEGREATRLAAELGPDVVVLDLQLPDIAGREVLSDIRTSTPDSKVVVYSGRDPSDERWVADQVEAYVFKDAALDYLVDLLEAVTRPRLATTTLRLPRESASVPRARRFVEEVLGTWGVTEVDDALIVVSELVGNAVVHAATASVLDLSVRDDVLRIEVLDHGSGSPEPRPLTLTAEDGRGLHLVDSVARAWGIDALGPTGKTVWAELALHA